MRRTLTNDKNGQCHAGVLHSPTGLRAKVELRSQVLERLGCAARVLEVYGGEAVLYDAVWSRAELCTAIDLVWRGDDPRERYVGDALTVLAHLDLGRWNVFDVDAFGCPNKAMAGVIRLRRWLPGERAAFVATDGTAMHDRCGRVTRAKAAALGIAPGHEPGSAMPSGCAATVATSRAAFRALCARAGDIEWLADAVAVRHRKFPMLYSAAVVMVR